MRITQFPEAVKKGGLMLALSLVVGSGWGSDRLSIRVPVNAEFGYVHTSTGGQDTDAAGLKMQFRHEHNRQFRVAVRDIDDAGYVLDMTLLRVWGWEKTPFGEKESYDSFVNPAEPDIRHLAEVGDTFRVRVSKDGRLVSSKNVPTDRKPLALQLLERVFMGFPRIPLTNPRPWTTAWDQDIYYSVVHIESEHHLEESTSEIVSVRSSGGRFTEARVDTGLPLMEMLESQLGKLAIAEVVTTGTSTYSLSDGMPVSVECDIRMAYGVVDGSGKVQPRDDFTWILTEQDKIERVAGTHGPKDPTPDRLGVLRYWPRIVGSTIVVEGDTFHDGRQIGHSTMSLTLMPSEIVEGTKLFVQRMSLGGEIGQASAEAMTIYQYIDQEKSCTYGFGSPGKDPTPTGCAYVDLKGPLSTGSSWEFVDTFTPSSPGDEEELEIRYRALIEETGLEVTIGDREFTDCLRVVLRGSAHPERRVSCSDGSAAIARIELEMTRWFCPGIGPVKDVELERYLREEDGGSLCTEFKSLFEASRFLEP